MTVKTSSDPVTRLAELERARDVARAAEEQARDEHASLMRAVPVAREQLTESVATGEGVDAATKRFADAQKAASDPAWGARAEGRAARTRAADAAVRVHINEHVASLVEEVRPRAEAAVAAIKERAADLRDALAEYHAVGGEISRRCQHVQWLSVWERTPRAPLVDQLGSLLDAARLDDEQQLCVPMPNSTLRPVEEAQRLRLAAEMAA